MSCRASSKFGYGRIVGSGRLQLSLIRLLSSKSKLKPNAEVSPTNSQLKIVALRYGIPMIGFGFIDNLVMITAGDLIDQQFGVTLGLSTLTAAGLGQCVSDVSGCLSGGLVDGLCSKLKIPHHHLTEKQLDMKISRVYRTVGCCIGVLAGCLLGMSCLLFIDTDAAERARRAKELESIFINTVHQGRTRFGAERATLYLLDEKNKEIWSQVATGEKEIIKLKSNQGLVGASISSAQTLNVEDAYNDTRFHRSVDERSHFRTRSVLVSPVKDEEGKVLGAIQMLNKKNQDGDDCTFTAEDVKMIEMLSCHVASFLRVVGPT